MNKIFTCVFVLFFGFGVLKASSNVIDLVHTPVENPYLRSGLLLSAPFQDDIDIKVSPNPANDYFNVVSNINFNRIQLYNILGKPLKSYRPSLDNTYQLNDIPGGIYILRFMDANNQVLKTIKLYKKS